MQKRVMGMFLGIIAFQTFSLGAFAAYKEAGSCGTASVVSGDTCSNVKVQFKFDGCEDIKGTELAKKIICVGEVISARYQVGDIRYQASYEKIKDKKGAVTWKALGGVKRLVKTTIQKSEVTADAPLVAIAKTVEALTAHEAAKATPPATATAPITPPATEATQSVATPAPAPVAAPQATTIASPFKFGGFADLRYTSYVTNNDPSVASGNPSSGFGIEDGAVYVNYEKEKMSITADLAFRRGKDSDTNAAATQPNQSSTGAIALGVDKSQLYLKYKLGSMFTIDLGQFDTIFGAEVNDSKDRLFNKTGTTYDFALPVTHTGAMLEFARGGFAIKAFAANPNNKGSNGTSTAGDDKTEYGGAIGYTNDSFHGQIGYMGRPINQASGVGTATRSLTDATAGVSLGAFALDAEYARVSDPSKNTLTPLDNTDLENAGEACLGLISYKFSDAFLVGIRYETVIADPSAGAIGGSTNTPLQSANSTGLVIHYKVNPELELRSEYIGYNGTGMSGNTWTDGRFDASALVSF